MILLKHKANNSVSESYQFGSEYFNEIEETIYALGKLYYIEEVFATEEYRLFREDSYDDITFITIYVYREDNDEFEYEKIVDEEDDY